MLDNFSRAAQQMVDDHGPEFFLNSNSMLIHLPCGWNHTLSKTVDRPYGSLGVRAVMILHLEREHKMYEYEREALQERITQLNHDISARRNALERMEDQRDRLASRLLEIRDDV